MICEKSKRSNCHGKYHKINKILFEWYKGCCASNIYPNGLILKEEAMAIKEQLQKSDFDNFSNSDGWLDCWKTTYSIKERRIVGEAGGEDGYFLDEEDKRIDWRLLIGKKFGIWTNLAVF